MCGSSSHGSMVLPWGVAALPCSQRSEKSSACSCAITCAAEESHGRCSHELKRRRKIAGSTYYAWRREIGNSPQCGFTNAPDFGLVTPLANMLRWRLERL